MFGSSLALLLRSSWSPEVGLGIVMYRRRGALNSRGALSSRGALRSRGVLFRGALSSRGARSCVVRLV